MARFGGKGALTIAVLTLQPAVGAARDEITPVWVLPDPAGATSRTVTSGAAITFLLMLVTDGDELRRRVASIDWNGSKQALKLGRGLRPNLGIVAERRLDVGRRPGLDQ